MSKRIDLTGKRAALYARVSTEEQAMHGVSLEAQRERLFGYAEEHGLDVVGLYVDEGISARGRYQKRGEFMHMLRDVENGRIDVILFIKLDRWFRSISDYYEVQAILDRHRVVWIATEEDYDTASANGRLSLNIRLAIAQDESDRTSERIRFVFQNMVREGRVISGRTPMGFTIREKRAVIDEEKAPIVREAFRVMLDTRSLRATAKHLYLHHGISIDPKSLKRLLTNRWCIGEAYGIPDWCPALVERPLFDAVGEILCTRSSPRRTRREENYLFSGLLFCSSCGRRMSGYFCANRDGEGKIKQSYLYYRCPAHANRCCANSLHLNQKTLEGELCRKLFSGGESFLFTQELSHPRSKEQPTEERLKKLRDLYLDGLLSRELYREEYQRLSPVPSQKPSLCEASKVLTGSASAYDALSPERKKAFWSRLVRRIEASEDGSIRLFPHAPLMGKEVDSAMGI